MLKVKLGLMAALLATAGMANADSGKTPLVVEMFTSKFCPSCPMAESKLEGVAKDNPDLLVIFEHVDYWDRHGKKDPYGLADITQRQYDVGNALGRRSGEVFTPMPLIEGQILVKPPLMFTWGSALEDGRKLPEKPRLETVRNAEGDLEVTVPPALYAANRELWILAIEPVPEEKVWRVRGITQGNLQGKKGDKVHVANALLADAPAYVALLQESGPSKIVAMGSTGVQK